MDAHSLATVLAPAILPNLTNQKEYTLTSVSVVRQFIDTSTELFQVPTADWSITETLLCLQTSTKDRPAFSDSVRLPAQCGRENISPLTASCYVPKQDTTLTSPDIREERVNSEFGQKVRRFFKRALHSPFDSPTSLPKLKLGKIPSPTGDVSNLRERSRSHAELVRELSNQSPINCDIRHPTAPSILFRAATENTMRHNIVPTKQQFIIRPIPSPQPSPDIGPSPRVLLDTTHAPLEYKPYFSRYATHIKPLNTSQSDNVSHRYRSNSSQSATQMYGTKYRTVLNPPQL